MASSGAMNDPAAQARAQQKIDQARALIREARAELESWAPPTAVNDLQAADNILAGLAARLPERPK